MATTPNGQKHDRSALVLYGSETGNSEECAEELGRMLQRQHFTSQVHVLDDVEINILPSYTIVLFVISTTGQGEFPRNARKFWKSLLRKRLPPNCLDHVRFTTFGLGDSSYSKFNWSARKLHKRLEQLGAKDIYPRGEGDDQHNEGWDGTFFSWKLDLGKVLLTNYPLPDGQEVIPSDIPLPPKYTLEIIPEDERAKQTSPQPSMNDVEALRSLHITQDEAPISTSDTILSHDTPTQHAVAGSSSLPDPSNAAHGSTNMKIHDPPEWHTGSPAVCQQLKDAHSDIDAPPDKWFPLDTPVKIPGSLNVELIKNSRATPESHWQDVRHLTFLVPDSVDYLPGDVMTIYPKNFPEDVQTLIDLQGWGEVADEPLRFERSVESLNTGSPELITSLPRGLEMAKGSSLRDLLTSHLDITAIPKRNFLQNMSYFTNDEMHKERLQEFCNPMYTDEFFDYTTRPRRSTLEVLHEFSSVKLPWHQAASLFPTIRGRQFSITTGGQLAHSSKQGAKKVDLLVAIVKYRTVLKKIRQGLCTRYLAGLPEGTTLQVTFDRPSDKFYDLTYREPKRPVLMVAAGTGIAPCRSLIWERATRQFSSRASSFGKHVLIYGARNQTADYFYGDEWPNQELNVQVSTAFSRDQREKIYVQDVIRKQSQEIWSLITRGAVIYICGSAGAMPKAVRQAFVDVLMEFVGVGDGSERDMEDIKGKAESILEDMTRRGRYIEETW